ncbi:hypothetical protein SAMN05216388_10422 [Halorientalis persicus]|uniref:Uncharacterized protein n=1 Tax=Halorientalis persicus TaxID=1367881 RepID=A0A1H8VVF6_9EURY|nr:hypothetical protein [Halorientalis persicus]SEP18898.1 hypothetical protein SAMN05216388_10422 [Halorientalis persicus]
MLDFAEDIQQIQQGLDELSGLDLLSEEDQEELDSLRDETKGMSTAVQGMQRLVSVFSREDDIYRAVISDGSDIEFVLIPDKENFQNLPMDFPSVDNDYLILGKVQTKFNKGDSVELINFSQLVSGSTDNPRQKKTQEKQQRMRFSKMASDISGRSVEKDEFVVSHPDVQILPLAIY